MDIKLLLLESLSLKKPISGSRRIYCGRACFVINYTLNGKILKIKSIKHKRKRKTWAQRIKCCCRTYRMLESKKMDTTNTMANENENVVNYNEQNDRTNDTSPSIRNISSQTSFVRTDTKEVQTEEMLSVWPKSKEILNLSSGAIKKQLTAVTSTGQQTIASVLFGRYHSPLRKSVYYHQTNAGSDCKGIQCDRFNEVKTANIHVNTKDNFAQVENNLFDEESSGDSAKLLAVPAKDFDVLIYMLNEIGDTVMGQNELLCTNSVMMKRIMQTSTSRISKNNFRSISTQTVKPLRIEKTDNCSQTVANYMKAKKMLLFKGRNTQRNKE